MVEKKLSREEFREGANLAIQSVLNIYHEVRYLFSELNKNLEDMPDPMLKSLGVRLRAKSKGRDDDNKILYQWEGRLYRLFKGDDEDEDDTDVEELETEDDAETQQTGRRKRRKIDFEYGEGLLFAKVEIYKPRKPDHEPYLMYGLLTNCRVEDSNFPKDKPLSVQTNRLYLIQRDLDQSTWTPNRNQIKTRAGANPVPKWKPKKSQKYLLFDIPFKPNVIPLYKIDSTEKVNDIAGEMKEMWRKFNGTQS